jgi:tRNA threonylcarbamoyladenosine biosynthesis protein TsaE
VRFDFELPDEDATLALGARLARALLALAGDALIVRLRGDLGAGKTTLVRGWLRALGHAGAVKSPTYTLAEPYRPERGPAVVHFDLYRLGDADELDAIGFRDYLAGGATCLLEWPERAEALLASAELDICLAAAGAGRRALVDARSERVAACLATAFEDAP